MKSKIFRSIFTVAVCVLLACLVLIFGFLYSHFTAVQDNQLSTILTLSAAGVEKNGVNYFENLKTSCRLTWIDADGRVLYDSEKNANQMENHSEREEIREAFSSGAGESIRYSSTLTEKTLNRAVKLTGGTVLRASVSITSIWLLVIGMIQPIAIIFAAALIVSIILSYRLSERITKPMEALDLGHPLDKEPYEELLPLLRKIDNQNKKIEKQKKELADKRLQMEFAEENRREFTANVSHELKTPLQSIIGSAELLENGLVKLEDVDRFISGIRKESTRLLALIDDIIHLSCLDENSTMEFSDVDIYAVCEEEIESLTPIANDRAVELNLIGSHCTFSAVPQLVKEIVHNLLDNAVKYNKQGGKVTVRVMENDTQLTLSVSDTGIGIPKEHTEHIFERFYRVDKSHSKATGGTGLGLSIVKHAAAYLKGEIRLDSEVGVGTAITITFNK